TVLVSKDIYQVKISFGNKTIYFDPKDGKSPSSRTIDGVIRALAIRKDIDDLENLILEFGVLAKEVIRRMKSDGYDFE
ncbi:hypothetical protein IR022_09825, partial [Dysgonomonas sp. GY617]|nr:hypothetical protein [Dysgonomonas sp. GY617]MBF0576268.1 hypothetical protein [Dysgonomonas sp. GY617]